MAEPTFFEAARSQRGTRRYSPKPVSEDTVHRILEAATWAPSGGNVQPWRVIVTQDAAKRRRLQELYIGPWKQYAKDHQAGIEHLAGEARAQQKLDDTPADTSRPTHIPFF